MAMEEAISFAESIGLGGVLFTDHFDVDPPGNNGHFSFDPIKQQAKIDRLRLLTDIFVGKGIELGLQPNVLESAKRAVALFKFDVVIASVHFVDGVDPYHDNYYEPREEREAYGRYLETIYECISGYKDFDILGHFDYITRYSPYKNKSLTMSGYGDYLDPILRVLANDGKALEINTNTYRSRAGTSPVLDIGVIKHFRAVGGEFVTIGSDAHDFSRVGDGFSEAIRLVAESGFEWTTSFRERAVVKIPLI